MTEVIVVAILGMVGLILAATVGVMRNREKTRRAAREAEDLSVISDDTRRSFWSSAADDGGHGGDSSDGGGSD